LCAEPVHQGTCTTATSTTLSSQQRCIRLGLSTCKMPYAMPCCTTVRTAAAAAAARELPTTKTFSSKVSKCMFNTHTRGVCIAVSRDDLVKALGAAYCCMLMSPCRHCCHRAHHSPCSTFTVRLLQRVLSLRKGKPTCTNLLASLVLFIAGCAACTL
jgi:hypothetical protein